ncbi:hypothetical protein FEZ39_12440 [Lentilactobacillus parabuchneri]|uniref:Uncharacterized protein n=1 Tax=Lentilactobacillus parabuchneri TaxID=152331 RepID=A0A1X1FD83_9LACO|nr:MULTISPECIES: hypothetical protein [Lentilactobacillus]ORN27279.1 hypothetical protein FAM23169_01821 [Lentilactobacillus parabuchneri]TJY08820.1 hypothetical protein FCF15_10305 [Lentilactobacillus buchneri]TLQ28271.1 hypothetical protein FEZ39_12440 [Lentilactobacillus parabuchneri]
MIDKNTSFELKQIDLLDQAKSTNISLILENGSILLSEIKKAQQLSAELGDVLNRIKHFNPEFRMK